MQKQDPSIKLDENGMMADQTRGFTERSLNQLLKKICDDESRQEALATGAFK